MSVRRRAVKVRVERKRALDEGFRRVNTELRLLQRVIDDARADGLTTLSEAQLAQRIERTRRMMRC